MNLSIFTIVLNGGDYIRRHLPIFEQLKSDWHWYIAHGSANNGGSTAWCQSQTGGLSTDGTTEYLASIKDHSRVTVIERKLWKSKDDQVNAALAKIKEPGVLLEVDCDELWEAHQIDAIVQLFTDREQLSSIMFACRYFVGPRLVLQGDDNCYGSNTYEWLRAWRYVPGRKFIKHEPPVLEGDDPDWQMPKTESRKLIGEFRHYAYATEEQCVQKEKFYGYKGLVRQWRALQEYDAFPVELARFFAHVNGTEPKVVRV